MIQDKDLQPLFDFENELCFIINTQPLTKCIRLINDNYRCQKFLTNLPDTLTTTGFVQKFFSNMMTNTYDEDKLLWLSSFTYYMVKHAEAICSYRCAPNWFLLILWWKILIPFKFVHKWNTYKKSNRMKICVFCLDSCWPKYYGYKNYTLLNTVNTTISKHHFNLYLLKLVCIYVPKTYQAHSCNKYLMGVWEKQFQFFIRFFGTDSYFILIVGKI